MDEKALLSRYYHRSRDSLMWKVEGLSERQVRMPLTPTGTNLLGLLKHVAGVDVGYLGEIFGRPFPHPVLERIDADPSTDMWAAADEPAEMIIGFARDAWAHTDQTIADLDLETTTRVPWWGPDAPDVTLRWMILHVISETAQHLGHADIVRELVDGRAGLSAARTNLPDLDTQDWAEYTGRLRALAESFPG
jgi:uncharacterized damage-inducible protein DinB